MYRRIATLWKHCIKVIYYLFIYLSFILIIFVIITIIIIIIIAIIISIIIIIIIYLLIYFDEIRGIRIDNESLSRVFDTSS